MQATKDLFISAHDVGTRGFRAPEVTMNKDYNEKCDVFSIGVILFVMLTNKMPFSRVIKDNDNNKSIPINKATKYSLESSYQLFCESNNTFWMKLIGIMPNTNQEVRNLIFRMLNQNPGDRIAVNEITLHQWYNAETPRAATTTTSNDRDDDVAFKLLIESLINQRNEAKINENININSHNERSLPAWVVEDETFEYTTDMRNLIDALTGYVETILKGNVQYYQESQTLHCYAKDPFVMEFGVSIYESSKWNRLKSVSKIYTILVELVKGTKEQFEFIKRQMLYAQDSTVSKTITGIPNDLEAEYRTHQSTALDATSMLSTLAMMPTSPSLNEVSIYVFIYASQIKNIICISYSTYYAYYY